MRIFNSQIVAFILRSSFCYIVLFLWKWNNKSVGNILEVTLLISFFKRFYSKMIIVWLFNKLWWESSENWAPSFSPNRKLWEIPLSSSRWHDLGYHWINWLIKFFFPLQPDECLVSEQPIQLWHWLDLIFTTLQISRLTLSLFNNLNNVKRQRSLKEAKSKILSVLTRQPKSCLCIAEVFLGS